MKTSIIGINQTWILKNKLTIDDVLILKWLQSFISSGKQEYIEKNGRLYYWVKYSKILEDLPCLRIQNERVVERHFLRLSVKCSDGVPILEKVGTCVHGKRRVYYRFYDGVVESMEGKMISMITGKEMVTKNKTGGRSRVRKLNVNVQALLKEILNKDGCKFRNRMPSDSMHYTKTIENFQRKILALYAGRFLIEYPLSTQFMRKNESHDIGKAKKKILQCKGDWKKINKLIKIAIGNYSSWFENGNEPESKDWLPTDLSNWMYFEKSGSSLFVACINDEAFPLRENMAANVFNSINPAIVKACEPLHDRSWDSVAFYTKIKQISDWYDKYIPMLSNMDTNVQYWVDGGKVRWFGRYVEFVQRLTGGRAHFSNVGTSNKTWEAFLIDAQKEHGVVISLQYK